MNEPLRYQIQKSVPQYDDFHVTVGVFLFWNYKAMVLPVAHIGKM